MKMFRRSHPRWGVDWLALARTTAVLSVFVAGCGDDGASVSATGSSGSSGSTGGDTTSSAGTTTTTTGMPTGGATMGTTAATTSGATTMMTTGATGDTDGGSTGMIGPQPCPEADAGAMVPVTMMGSNVSEDDELEGSCVPTGLGGREVTHTFTAPTDGTYTFTTEGSDFDTVLYVQDGAMCGGAELGCADDIDTQFQIVTSRLAVGLTAGQQVLVVVDGFDAMNDSIGNYVLDIDRVDGMGACCSDTGTVGCVDIPVQSCVCALDSDCCFDSWDLDCAVMVQTSGCGICSGSPCPEVDLGTTVPQTVTGSTLLESDSGDPSCGFNQLGVRDAGHLFTAPADGTFVFDTNGSMFDTLLWLIAGADCAGAELACDDDGGAGSQASQIVRQMTAGEQVVVMVDGNNGQVGSFTLNVSELTCPDQDIGSMAPQTVNGSNLAGSNVLGGSCDFNNDGNEIKHLFTAPSDGTFNFSTAGSAFNTVLYALEGSTCGGNELACDRDFSPDSSINLALTMGEQVVIVVDGDDQFQSGNYTLNVQQIACPDLDVMGALPQTVNGTNVGAPNFFEGSCDFTTGGNEVTHSFTAPSDGVYFFDTTGSAFNNVLYVLDGGMCGGPELGCTDNTSTSAQVSVPLAAGQEVTVVVDGNGTADSGAYTLTVDQVPCPQQDIGMTVPQSFMGNNAAASNFFEGSCDFTNGGNEVSHLFTAPNDGLFRFDTTGTSFNAVLYAVDGAACQGAELACDDNFSTDAAITVPLASGEQVAVIVDGNGTLDTGAYTLNVSQATCPDQTIMGALPQAVVGDNVTASDFLEGSCDFTSGGNEVKHAFTAPADGDYVFHTGGTTFNTVLYVLEGGACLGGELACDDNTSPNAAVALTLTMGQEVVVVVDGNGTLDTGNYTLTVDALACPAEDLGNAAPVTFMGTTVTSPDQLQPTCGGGTGGDVTHRWTAPATANYRIDTFGSVFDTVLYVQNGNMCGGTEIACNDQSPTMSPQSEVTVPLTMGQEIVIVVDGFFQTSAGNYTLNITQL